MGLFDFLKKKRKGAIPLVVDHTLPPDYGWTQGATGEPLQPLAQLEPPQERPQSFSAADMQTLLAKLDLITERLGSINQRLEALERALQMRAAPAPGAYQQPQQQAAPLRRW